MVRKLVLLNVVFALALSSVCCTKLPAPAIPTGPPVSASVMPPIPLDSGELVAVTPGPVDPHWVVLWFHRPDKTIVVHWVNITTGVVGGQVTIPRK
jgi:hypothetical protein